MKRPLHWFFVVLGLFILCTNAFGYNILTLDMGGYWNDLQTQQYGAQPGYGAPGLPGERWYTTVTPQAFASADLMHYDVLLVQSGFTDDYVTQPATAALNALEQKAADIAGFVQAGHGLVAWSEPFPNGADWAWNWAPLALTSRGINHENPVEIVNPAHPVMQGLHNQDLSDWHASWHGYFESWDPRLDLLAQTGDFGSGDPRTNRALTLGGIYDQHGGRMVFSMQDPDYHSYQGYAGAELLSRNALDWAGTSSPIPEPNPAALLAVGLFASLTGRRLAARGAKKR